MGLINLKNYKKIIIYLYLNFIPRFLKIKLCNLFDLDFSRLRDNVGIRAEDYFQALKKEIAISDKDKIDTRYIHNAFKKHLVRSKLIDTDWWSDFLVLNTLSNGSKFDQINNSLITRIETSNFNSLEYFELLDIYSLCIRLSLFELGYKIRKKALNIALLYSPSSKKIESWKLRAKLSALIETKGFSEFDHLFPLFKSRKKKEKYFLSFLRIVFGNTKIQSDLSSLYKLDSKEDQMFRKFVENKKIVIVGPAPVKNENGFEIDNADIVLRTNYKIGDPIIKGSKCDINYFNLETAKHIEENGCSEWPSSTTWIIGKAWNYMKIIKKRLYSDGIKVDHIYTRILKRVDSALFNGSSSLIQNIIFDLSRYNPKEIYLYHFDVMLSKERIPGYYTDVQSDKELHLKMIKSFCGHDPVTQFMILKNFCKLGFIKGDDRFEQVMKMDSEDYMKNMQKNYRY